MKSRYALVDAIGVLLLYGATYTFSIIPNPALHRPIYRLSQSPQLFIILLQELPLLIPDLILSLLAHLLPQRRMERQYIQILGVIYKPLSLELLERVRQDGPLDLHKIIQELPVVCAIRAVDRQSPLDVVDIEPAGIWKQYRYRPVSLNR